MSLAIDRGLDFCQLHINKVRCACDNGKNGIYIIVTGNSVDVTGYCYTSRCYQYFFATFSLNIILARPGDT